jgi:anti-sigma28 factor (negative regulator of flagellin synthesis)
MRSTDNRERSNINRRMRDRHVAALKAMVQAKQYQVSADDIADGILGDAEPIDLNDRPGRLRN